MVDYVADACEVSWSVCVGVCESKIGCDGVCKYSYESDLVASSAA